MSPQTHLPTASRSRLCCVVALLRRLHSAQAQVDGPSRSAPRNRDPAQLSLLRARLYSSWRRRSQPARWFRHVRRLRRLGDRVAGHVGASHGTDTSAFLAVRRRLQSRGSDRHHPRLLPRRPGRPSCAGGPVGRHVRDPDHLRARADDHARRRSLLAGASTWSASSGVGRSCRYT